MIAIVDYGRGNLFSLGRALEHCGAPGTLAGDAAALAAADAILLPGVGAFADAMRALAERGLIAPLRAAAARGTPMLGICLGMQLLFSESEEFGRHEGLGLLPGRVCRLPLASAKPPSAEPGSPERPAGQARGFAQAGLPTADEPEATRIPNVGWRPLAQLRPDPLLDGAVPGAMYYFVHSYAPRPAEPSHVVATLPVNGSDAAVVVRRGNVAGVQFHPEKSGPAGLALLARFVAATRRAAA